MTWQKGDLVKVETKDTVQYLLVLETEKLNELKHRHKMYKVYNIRLGFVFQSAMTSDEIFRFTLHSRY
jgi:hypothetical protein